MGFLTKKERFTLYTAIPPLVPRQLAIDLLHDHAEVLEANPLVLAHWPTQCPTHAAADEHQALWYEITQRIQYVPGLGKMGASTINFTGCFQDRPWGLETHIYAPLGVDLRNTYRVAGFLPNSPQSGQMSPHSPVKVTGAAEEAPAEGLYLRTDVEVECSVGFAGLVRSQTKTTLNKMVSRMVERIQHPASKASTDGADHDRYAVYPSSDQDLVPAPLSVPPAAKPTATTTTTPYANVQGHGPTEPIYELSGQPEIHELAASERA